MPNELTRIRSLSLAVAQTTVIEWLNLLHRQTAEQAFIDGTMTRDEAIDVLGLERVEEIEYAKQALAQDIARGLGL